MPRYTFGPFLLDTEARTLLRDGEPIPIAGKTFDTLVVLVQNRGRLIDKDEFLSKVWPGTVVEEANLSQGIFTLRKILGDNSKDPRYIATIAGRGYQFVTPVTELTSEAPQQKRVAIGFIAVAVAAIGILAAGLLYVLRRPAKAPAELVERRLTFNSSASPITSAAISKDGKYLAYSDPAGIHVRLLATGEERLIATPAAVSAGSISHVDCWFPNGTELLAHAVEPDGRLNMWTISAMGRSSRELRADTSIGQVSPDGSQIVFRPLGKNSEPPEIWVMDHQGNNQRKVLGLPAGELLWSLHWSPDGQRLAYIRTLPNRQVIETCDLKGASRTAVLVAAGEPVMHCIYWLPDGRIIYSYLDRELWQIGVDTHTGTPLAKPKRIIRWAEFDLEALSASADGTRLVLQKVTSPDQVYIAELSAGGTRIRTPQRLTNNEAHEAATAWTADSKAVLFASDRGGKSGIFKQEIGQDTAVPLVEGRDEVELPRLSPDGAWVLYRDTEVTADRRSRRYRMMRVLENGGLPERVFESTAVRLLGDHQCARGPASLCVLVEISDDEKRLTVTAFDPIKGKGKLLRSIEKPIHEDYAASLSPDGSTYAFARGDQPQMHISLLSLNGGPDREVEVKGWPTKASLDWSADGKGLYIGSNSSQGASLLYVDLKGAVQVVWQSKEVGAGGYIGALPSPDGRYLAIFGTARSSNAWMLEGF